MKPPKLHPSTSFVQLCKFALGKAADPQLVLLSADELEKAGDTDGARAIRDLVGTSMHSKSDATTVKSVVQLSGDELTRTSRIPVDRETSAPVASITVVKSLPTEGPVLSPKLAAGIESWVNEWHRAAELIEVGIEPARSCVLFGEPGTGKTQLALWLARQLELPVIVARLDGLMSSFLGTTSRNIGNLFDFANRHRALLVLDEFDAIAKLRDDPNEVGEIKRVVNTLLQKLDERAERGLTIGITNHPQLLDPAVWRRFELQIELPKPELGARVEIIGRYAEPLKFGDAQSKLLAVILEGASGAEIQDVVKSLKKSWILDSPTLSFAERLQTVISIHAARVSSEATGILNMPLRELARAFIERYAFNTVELGEVFGVNRTTISRWVS
ncbi:MULTISPECIES: ATP-binding protein [unclassified Caballeronia]|uniref:AAA family ATPase n=1 Tax=unclassified Caballeronia TaxID=2646786 RepID=UPI0028607506|nr:MULTISPECIES: ATP-binding protein [unclassified Caballeronia]MDR5751297.1 ATP-binding protein [Caballeronia sp. LZ024]MDR5844565.1 ATP-binding protein [Caballeronia sp. LZ031]